MSRPPTTRLTLREARKHRGWTQEDLERASGVAQAVISMIERGHDMRVQTVARLARALKMTGSVTDTGTLVFEER